MRLIVNGEPVETGGERVHLDALLAELGYATAPVAVAVNEEFVPRGAYAERTLQPGDRVDIVRPMQGG